MYIEFPGSFLEIGDDNNIIPDELEFAGVKIKILSPTDCVKDRLASYIYLKARECFDQALLLSKNHPIDIAKVKKWCKGENKEGVFEEFSDACKNKE